MAENPNNIPEEDRRRLPRHLRDWTYEGEAPSPLETEEQRKLRESIARDDLAARERPVAGHGERER